MTENSKKVYSSVLRSFSKSGQSPCEFIESAKTKATARLRYVVLKQKFGKVNCQIRGGKKLPTFLTHQEVHRILKDLRGERKLLFATLYFTGMRISEALSIRREDALFSLKTGRLKITGKGSKERIISLPQELKKIWLEDLKTSSSPWLLHRRSKKLNLRTAQRWVCAISQKVQKRVSPHTLRHSFAVRLLEQKAPLFYIKEKLGHASISTTQIYLHLGDALAKKMDQKFLNNL